MRRFSTINMGQIFSTFILTFYLIKQKCSLSISVLFIGRLFLYFSGNGREEDEKGALGIPIFTESSLIKIKVSTN